MTTVTAPPGPEAATFPRPATLAEERPRVLFCLLRALGHTSLAANLRAAVDGLNRVDARWLETDLSVGHPVLARLPGLPSYLDAGLRALVEVRRELRRRPADVLFFNPQNLAMLCQREMWSTPTILMTDLTPIQHDRVAAAYRHQADRGGVMRALKHRANRHNYRLARAVVALSTWTRDSLVDDYAVPAEHVHVIPVGVDTQRWHPPEGPPRSGQVRLLFVGNDFVRKGGYTLLEAFQARGLAGRAELHVVSTGPVPEAPGLTVHRHLRNNERELVELYQRADLFVLPTLADGLPNAALEAAASGLPIVASPVGGLSDVVVNDETGLLVPAGDPAALAAALTRLVDDPDFRRRLGASGRARAVARFDARTNAARLLDLVQALTDRRG